MRDAVNFYLFLFIIIDQIVISKIFSGIYIKLCYNKVRRNFLHLFQSIQRCLELSVKAAEDFFVVIVISLN